MTRKIETAVAVDIINQKPACILLLNKSEYLADAAENFCRTLFNVRLTTRCDRSSKLPQEVFDVVRNERIDFLFNFLSPLKVPEEILNAVKITSINFHPAPPEHPGVGCASYAIYNALRGGPWEYGVCAHIMEKTFDSGKILKVTRFPISKDDYCDTLFDRALDYTLLLFYDVLCEIATKGHIEPCEEKWNKKSGTRKEFEEWMTLRPSDSEEEAKHKIRATKHSRFPGPYVEIFGEKFILPPRRK